MTRKGCDDLGGRRRERFVNSRVIISVVSVATVGMVGGV